MRRGLRVHTSTRIFRLRCPSTCARHSLICRSCLLSCARVPLSPPLPYPLATRTTSMHVWSTEICARFSPLSRGHGCVGRTITATRTQILTAQATDRRNFLAALLHPFARPCCTLSQPFCNFTAAFCASRRRMHKYKRMHTESANVPSRLFAYFLSPVFPFCTLRPHLLSHERTERDTLAVRCEATASD